VATSAELADFLKCVEKQAFKRALYQVRDQEAALDIVQDSMLRLAEHYGHKTVAELPMLFHRILSNCTLDWFRRQKVHKSHFSSYDVLINAAGADDELPLDQLLGQAPEHESPESQHGQRQTLQAIEQALVDLPDRQREAFLLRYWQDMDVAETAAAMACSEGSVKTHCFRAIHALAKALKARNIRL
jgi:RNA polymerase sigma-70 factor (ECF subfamily)